MKGYKFKEMEALNRQLLYLPQETQNRICDRLEELLRDMNLDSDYSYEFVYFKLTGFRPDENLGKTYRAKDIRPDLLKLLTNLSEAHPICATDVDEYVYSIEELEQMYNISVRTIFRWRKRGLVSRKYVFPDGRRRTGVRKSGLEAFVGENRSTVERSSRFSKLTSAEKEQIIELASFYASKQGLNLTTASDRIARELGRSRETIRYILRRHDAGTEDEKIFPEGPALVLNSDQQRIYDAYRNGESVDRMAKRMKLSRSSVYRVINHVRAMIILNEDFSFIPNPEFDDEDADAKILEAEEPEGNPKPKAKTKLPSDSSSLPPYLRSLYDIPLLTKEQEQYLFRKYNYLKSRIAKLRVDINLSRYVSSRLLDEIETLWTAAKALKNRIVKSNLRLVVSVAKRHASPSVNLFDLISEGNFCLMYAIEKFDFSRGNRFSTYATWALMKNFARTVPEENYLTSTFITGQQEILNIIPERDDDSGRMEAVDLLRQRIAEVISKLTDREQKVIRSRFGLDSDGQTQTLAEVGEELGVTRERIRQIEHKALEKLRKFIDENQVEMMS